MLALYTLAFGILHVSYSIAAVLDCNELISVGGHDYNIAGLAKQSAYANQTRETPPTKVEDSLQISLCEGLPRKEGVSKEDQCPEGTRACLIKTVMKDSQKDLVHKVIPLFNADSSTPEKSSVTSSNSKGGFSLLFTGPKYPPKDSNAPQQRLNLTLICGDEGKNPEFVSYDGTTASVSWLRPEACLSTSGGDKDKTPPDNGGDDDGHGEEGGPTQRVGSGMGWFFFVMFLAAGAYLGIGAYYNYSTYGASGWDLVPHRDFWREVPYMLRDVASHLCSGVRARPTSRGGYVAV